MNLEEAKQQMNEKYQASSKAEKEYREAKRNLERLEEKQRDDRRRTLRDNAVIRPEHFVIFHKMGWQYGWRYIDRPNADEVCEQLNWEREWGDEWSDGQLKKANDLIDELPYVVDKIILKEMSVPS